jgi:hypothetical protein
MSSTDLPDQEKAAQAGSAEKPPQNLPAGNETAPETPPSAISPPPVSESGPTDGPKEVSPAPAPAVDTKAEPVKPVVPGTHFGANIQLGGATLKNTEVIAIKAMFLGGDRSIADRIDVDIKPHVNDSIEPIYCGNLRLLAFAKPFPAAGLVLVQYPDEEVLGAARSAALAALNSDTAAPVANRVQRIVVTFRDQQPDWLNPTINKIVAEMDAKEAIIGVFSPRPDSQLHEDFIRSHDLISVFDQSLRQANKLLVVFLQEQAISDRVIAVRRESDLWFIVRSETVLAAFFNREDKWVKEVRSLATGGAGVGLNYAELRSACEAALRFDHLDGFAEALGNDVERATRAFRRLVSQHNADGVFDLTGIFLAAHIPGLGISDFDRLATYIVGTLPPPQTPSETEKAASWPRWSPKELRRLRDEKIIELKTGADGSKRVFCSSPAVAARLRREFEDEYISLAELRRALLSNSLFAEGALTADQIVHWVTLVATAQADDAGTEAIRQLAKTFASDDLRRQFKKKDIGRKAAMAIASLWGATPEQDDGRGPAADFVRALLAEAGPEIAFQALRSCSRDTSNPIAPRALLNWTYRVFKAGDSIPETLIHAYVRDLMTIADSGRREVFVSRLLEWTLHKHEPEALRRTLRNSIANALWASLVTQAEDLPGGSTIEALPVIGGLSPDTCANLLASLAAEEPVRIIDSAIRAAFAATSNLSIDGVPTDWLEIPSGLILAFILAEWRERVGTADTAQSDRCEAWLRVLVKPIREDRKQRRYLLSCVTYLVDFFRYYRTHEKDREAQQGYVRLIKQLLWVRSELRLDPQSVVAAGDPAA